MRKLEAVSFVTFVMLMLRRVGFCETVIVSFMNAGEFEVVDIVTTMENKRERFEKFRVAACV